MSTQEFVVMTDEQIQEGLSICASHRFLDEISCKGCPYKGDRACIERLMGNALSYIKRLKGQQQ